ncbi:CRISPR-associated ring nuclease Csm6 [Undibacterium sp.]|uniref:CRISPR-associated ring nuclease Csm6 n=1 Tax=Undibacterium sp. TaxID=1914977 RepID=UPI003750C319
MNILILLVGMSPAVVTETIWALCENVPDYEKFRPDRIVVITTADGRKILQSSLLRSGATRAPLKRVIDLLDLPETCAQVDRGFEIRCPQSEQGVIYEDAHETDELDQMGDLIFSTVLEFTRSEDTRICLSLSGGRKSMSHLAGQTIALLARPRDFLVHVVVEPPRLEQCKDFYFPDPDRDTYFINPTHEDSNPEPVFRQDIELRLARVPFVRLGDVKQISDMVSKWSDAGLAAVIAATTGSMNPSVKIILQYHKKTGHIFVNGRDIETVPQKNGDKKILQSPIYQLAFLRLIAKYDNKELPIHFTETNLRDYFTLCLEIGKARGENVANRLLHQMAESFDNKPGTNPTTNSQNFDPQTAYLGHKFKYKIPKIIVQKNFIEKEILESGFMLRPDVVSKSRSAIAGCLESGEFSLPCINPRTDNAFYRLPESCELIEVD